MSYRQSGTPPGHGPGPSDDPYMIPEPAPIGEGPSQRFQALIALAIMAVIVVALLVLTAR
jgi:hypothetical protein